MRRNRWAMGILCAGLAIGGCSTVKSMTGADTQTWPLTVSSGLPAARGEAKVTPQKDGNTKLVVNVEHLASPEQAAPDATTYVVWVTPQGGGSPQNMGALTVDKNLNGSLTTMVPFRDFDVKVTAEPSAHATQPTRHQVMEARVHLPRTVQ